jgi:hypothetical protein
MVTNLQIVLIETMISGILKVRDLLNQKLQITKNKFQLCINSCNLELFQKVTTLQ